ncbi:MAG: Co2+/Mg2+ efflux protein ApaG [Gammaproteobacteria bacterium]
MSRNHEITVSVETQFMSEHSAPDDGRFVFAYTITIRNTGSVRARLLSRHWIITDSNGKVEEVRGPGVVGEHPHLAPGEMYRYTSAAAIETPVGTMHGSYQMLGDDGLAFDANILPFRLATTQTFH